MDAKRVALTLGVGMFCGLLGPAPAQAAPLLPEPIEIEAFDAPLVFVPVFGDLDAISKVESGKGFDEPILFLDIYAGYAVVETGTGEDEVSFDEPILFVPLHASPTAQGYKAKPGTGSALLSIPLQVELSPQQMEQAEDGVAFDVPLVGFDVPLVGFDVPLVGAVVNEALAEEVFGTPLVVIPLVGEPEAMKECEQEGCAASWLLPVASGVGVEAPMMLPVLGGNE